MIEGTEACQIPHEVSNEEDTKHRGNPRTFWHSGTGTDRKQRDRKFDYKQYNQHDDNHRPKRDSSEHGPERYTPERYTFEHRSIDRRPGNQRNQHRYRRRGPERELGPERSG